VIGKAKPLPRIEADKRGSEIKISPRRRGGAEKIYAGYNGNSFQGHKLQFSRITINPRQMGSGKTKRFVNVLGLKNALFLEGAESTIFWPVFSNDFTI
jgi:hypothetical protein